MSRFCRNCGKEIKEDSKFCEECGTSIKEDNSLLNKENNNRKSNGKRSKKIALIACACIVLVFFGSKIVTQTYRYIRDEKTRSQIRIKEDDEYIEVNQDAFARLLANELEKNDIPVSEIHKYKGTNWADKYRYDIELENGEKIYLTSNDENTIERIICRGDPNEEVSSLGNVVGVITILLVPSTTNKDLEKLNETFFKFDNLNSMFGEDYEYGHLVYEWYWDSVDNSFFQITIMPQGQYNAINS